MTDENRRRNVADELARAEQALQAARALLDLGLHADAVSRAYDAAVTFNKGDAEGCLRDAETFRADALSLLRREHWTE